MLLAIVVVITLGVVGVVGVLVADATNFKGPKVLNFMLQNKVGCPPYPYKNFERKKKQLIILRNLAKHI